MSRTWFETTDQAAPSSRWPSYPSPHSLPSSSSRHKKREEEPKFTLHHLLQTSQKPVAEKMFHHILWDVRENPDKAQYVKKLGTGLSLETLNEFATTPALPSLKIVCEFPMPWECIAEKKRFGSFETRNTALAYPPVTSAGSLVYGYSFSASLLRTRSSFTPPPRPQIPLIPLPPVTPLLPTETPANVVSIAPARAQIQKSREIGITISDLLHAIYDHLHYCDAELELLSDKQCRLVQEAYNKRCRTSFIPTTAVRSPVWSLSPVSPDPVSLAPSIFNAVTDVTPCSRHEASGRINETYLVRGVDRCSNRRKYNKAILESPYCHLLNTDAWPIGWCWVGNGCTSWIDLACGSLF